MKTAGYLVNRIIVNEKLGVNPSPSVLEKMFQTMLLEIIMLLRFSDLFLTLLVTFYS